MSELTSKLPLDAQYIIRRVKMTRFFVNELLYTPDPNKLVGTDMSPVFGFNVEKNFVNLTITFFIFYIQIVNIDTKKYETNFMISKTLLNKIMTLLLINLMY